MTGKRVWLPLLSAAGLGLPTASYGAAAVPDANIGAALLAALTFGGLFLIFALIFFLRYVRTGRRERLDLKNRFNSLRTQNNRIAAILNAPDQRFVVYSDVDQTPDVLGRIGGNPSIPIDNSEFLNFTSWLSNDAATELETAIGYLRERGTSFTLILSSDDNVKIEAAGRIAGAAPYIRFRDLGEENQRSEENERLTKQQMTELANLRGLMEGLDHPVWMRDKSGAICWTNPFYRQLLAEKDDGSDELFSDGQRNEILTAHKNDEVVRHTMPMELDGKRLNHEITHIMQPAGSAGIGIDVSLTDQLHETLRHTVTFHAQTLNQLASGVAIFDKNHRLKFYNAAYKEFWGFESAFLAVLPSDSEILDKLRTDGKLPHEADFKSWKTGVLAKYQNKEAREMWWHLPDRRTIRVLATPHPQGGVTYLYENVTEQLALESRYNTLINVQGETLDALKEAVAVFGSNGRLKLFNPAFLTLWQLDRDAFKVEDHISKIAEQCAGRAGDDSPWPALVSTVTTISDERRERSIRSVIADRSVVDLAIQPLPDGATLITFIDNSDRIRAEQALQERNEALEQSAKAKTTFIKHISYELRSPLTNILGFGELLEQQGIGVLNDMQTTYLDHILKSGKVLHEIIEDMLDLATIDAGIMELDKGPVEIRQVLTSVMEDLSSQLKMADIRLRLRISRSVLPIMADERRLRQIVLNLVTNAMNFSPEGSMIEVSVEREGTETVFVFTDKGFGIPDAVLPTVFEVFASHSIGGRKGGVGLGLPIVKRFIELHGGTVDLASTETEGTVVTIRLPDGEEADSQFGTDIAGAA